ncbi:hypothetical protein [Sinomonas soli]
MLEVTQRLTPRDMDGLQIDPDAPMLSTASPIERVIGNDVYQGFLLRTLEDELFGGPFTAPGVPGTVFTKYLMPTEFQLKYQTPSLSKMYAHLWPPDLRGMQDIAQEGFGPNLAEEVKPGDAVILDRARGNLAWIATLPTGTCFALINGPTNRQGWTLDRHTYCQIPVAGVVTGVRRNKETLAVNEIRILCGSAPVLSHFAAR